MTALATERNNMAEFKKSSVELIDFMGDDKRACHAARVSLLNDDLGTEQPQEEKELSWKDKRLLSFLMKEKHTSPFEHSVVSFRIYAPLPVVAQIMRHRTFSYNQASRRYTSEEVEFFEMGSLRKQGEKNLQCSDGELPEEVSSPLASEYKDHMVRSVELYNLFLKMGVAREQARFLLPQGLMACFWMTGNLHNFLKFLILRDDDHAQPECREVAQAIRAILEQKFPYTMELFSGVLK